MRRRAQLCRLADDLEADRDLPHWAQVGLLAAFVRSETVAPRRRPAGLGVLDLAPTVLIFMPIVITWIGLFSATRAYRESRSDSALQGMSFLQQWQSGFHGRLSSALYFDRIALWTLIAVAVLVSISIAQALVRRHFEATDREEAQSLLGRLADALTAVEFGLAEHRMGDGSRLAVGADVLAKAAGEIKKAGDAAKDTQKSAQEGLKKALACLDQVRRSADALQHGEEALRAAAQGVTDAAARLGGDIDDVATAAKEVVVAASDLTRSLNDGLATLRDGVRQTVTDSTREMRDGVEYISRELGTRLGDTVDAAGADIRTALDGWGTIGAIYSHRNEMAGDRLGLIVDSIEKLMDRTAAALEQLPAAIDGSEAAVRSLEASTTAATERLEGLSDATALHLEASINDAAERIKRQLDHFVAGVPDGQARTDQVIAELTALRNAAEDLRRELSRAGRNEPVSRWRWRR